MNPRLWINTIKYLEFFILLVGFVGFILTLNGMLTCPVDISQIGSCQDWGLGKVLSIRLISAILPIYAILNSLHIGLDHYLTVGEKSYTNLFSLGLFGLTFCFMLFALFKISPLIMSASQQNIVLLCIYAVTAVTVAIFLSDSGLWKNDSIFVKTRLLTSLIYLVASSVSAGLGVLVGIIVIPISLLVNSKHS